MNTSTARVRVSRIAGMEDGPEKDELIKETFHEYLSHMAGYEKSGRLARALLLIFETAPRPIPSNRRFRYFGL